MMQETNNMVRSSVVPKGNETIQKQSIPTTKRVINHGPYFF